MKKQLYCDIDSTINDHWVRIQKWALPKFPGTSIDPRAFTRQEILKDKVLPGALEAINSFAVEWEIHFLTARNFSEARSITKEWLDAKGFPYSSINVVARSKDKPPFLLKKKCDLFIDDLSAGQEFGPSYKNLYHGTIQQLKFYKIPFEIFKNNWDELVKKYT
jgi:hypothetical protein